MSGEIAKFADGHHHQDIAFITGWVINYFIGHKIDIKIMIICSGLLSKLVNDEGTVFLLGAFLLLADLLMEDKL